MGRNLYKDDKVVEQEFTVLDRMYDYDDALFLELLFNHNGLMLKAAQGRLGGSATIPLVPDPRWNFRYMRGETASQPLRDLIGKFTEIADWLDRNPGKSFSDYVMIQKLKRDV